MHENQMSITATNADDKWRRTTNVCKALSTTHPCRPPEPWTTVLSLNALSWQKTTWQEAWHTSTSNVQTLRLTYGSARVWREDQVMWV